MTKTKSLFLIILILIIFSGCSKYERNEFISLRSVKNRLVGGTWEKITTGIKFSFTFERNGDVAFFDGYSVDEAKWNLSKDKKTLTIRYSSGSSGTFTICKLTNKDMWFCPTPSSVVQYQKIK